MNERAPESGGNWNDLRGDRGSPLGDRDALVEAARRQTRAADELGQRLLTYTRVIVGLTVVLCVLTALLAWPDLSKWWPRPQVMLAMLSWWAQVIALTAGTLGAFFLAISQQKSQQISEGRPWGEVRVIVLEWPGLWRSGLWLLGAGFVLQLAALVLQRCGL